MILRPAQFAALILTALALVPSGAHLLELPNKIGLSQADYFVVQGVYRGWAMLGLLWIAALIANAVMAFLVRLQVRPFRLAMLSTLCFAVLFAIFFIWTLPANQATENWTLVPAGWDSLRAQWEYSHALNSAVVFIALCLTCLSVISWRPANS
ncbi:DUF1772 domain-containing protein [Hoeflea ulvae]|uniref:DUF1772 domain-containing protein n=1 Tax=Hoeflea ulvae TaxID=2983764 RepID=A0ABT3YJU1_9HYPH|nr:DUF1772 domain-containing protein [Hoeflea ulvae]MCY0096123.1 DUF1772 domain-containing protein [Hoeflea ulvae]